MEQDKQEPGGLNEAELEAIRKIQAKIEQKRAKIEQKRANQTAKKEQGEKPVCDVVDNLLPKILAKAEQNQTANQTATDQIQGRAIEDAKKTASITGTANQTANQKDNSGVVLYPVNLRLKLRLLHKHRATKNHYAGQIQCKLPFNENELPILNLWRIKKRTGGVDYLKYNRDGMDIKTGVSQDKNILALFFLVWKTNQKWRAKYKDWKDKAIAEFTFKEYAEVRGYKESEVRRGGEFYNELWRDLKMGEKLQYRVYGITEKEVNGAKVEIEAESEFYPSFYWLSQTGDLIIAGFNQFYERMILHSKPYLVHSLREIADRETTRRPYLHFFYNQLVLMKGGGVKIGAKNLLQEMGLNDEILERPRECYKYLRECLIYFNEHYPDDLNGVLILGDEKAKGLYSDRIRALPSDYERFRKEYGVDDIRAVQMQFLNNKKIEKKKDDKASKEFVINEILQWCDECDFDWQKLKMGKDGIKGMLNTYINELGVDYVYGLYRDFERNHTDEAGVFLFRTLKDHYEASKRANREY